MKDEHDQHTKDLIADAGVPSSARVERSSPRGDRQPKRGNSVARTIRESLPMDGKGLPDCLKRETGAFGYLQAFVPVAFVAKDWQVTSRRIRSLLAAKRLEGRRQENGYWEVAYPYHFIIGTRGPVLKKQQAPKRGRPKLVVIGE